MSTTKTRRKTRHDSLPPKQAWRNNDDRHFRSFHSWPKPESLHPSASTIERAVQGDICARAITAAYGAALRLVATIMPEVAHA